MVSSVELCIAFVDPRREPLFDGSEIARADDNEAGRAPGCREGDEGQGDVKGKAERAGHGGARS
jgi:hypothetical protein